MKRNGNREWVIYTLTYWFLILSGLVAMVLVPATARYYVRTYVGDMMSAASLALFAVLVFKVMLMVSWDPPPKRFFPNIHQEWVERKNEEAMIRGLLDRFHRLCREWRREGGEWPTVNQFLSRFPHGVEGGRYDPSLNSLNDPWGDLDEKDDDWSHL